MAEQGWKGKRRGFTGRGFTRRREGAEEITDFVMPDPIRHPPVLPASQRKADPGSKAGMTALQPLKATKVTR
jgi:hypothetical protein